MKRIYEILMDDDSAMMPRPASDTDIAQCKKDLADLGFDALGEDYWDFLKLHNGMAWDSVQFWGTDQVTDADTPRGFKLMDLVTMSDEYDERYYENMGVECIFIGRADEDFYVYNTEAKQYEVRALDEGCAEAYEIFPTIAALFEHVVGGRLGLLDAEDPDEAQYAHDEGRYDGEV